ncbi:MAG TPA: hypothetical protein VGN15_13855 [Ktedonobacteraceae bacterium]|nr:hypothetical protein [Ktedonobacteraceae bacterium]
MKSAAGAVFAFFNGMKWDGGLVATGLFDLVAQDVADRLGAGFGFEEEVGH